MPDQLDLGLNLWRGTWSHNVLMR